MELTGSITYRTVLISFLFIAMISCSKKSVNPPTPTPTPVPTKTKPTVVTSVEGFTQTTVLAKGTITSDGGDAVTERGFYWAKNQQSPKQKLEVSGNGTFSHEFAGLNPGDVLYVQAYAKNSKGEGLGVELQQRTALPPMPAITLAAITNITNYGATSGGTIATSSYPYTILERGVCIDTLPWPDISDEKTSDGTGTGSFVSTIANRIPGTKYYLRAYYKADSLGIQKAAYSAQDSFFTTGYHVGQDLGYGIVFKVWNNANNCKFAAKQDTVSGAGGGLGAGRTWDNLFPNTQWCNAISMSDGLVNTLAIMNALTAASAGRGAYAYTAGGMVPAGTFYLPAAEELAELVQISSSIPGLAGTFPGDPVWHRYWSSTEGTAINRARFVHNNGLSNGEDAKSGGGNLRPIGKK